MAEAEPDNQDTMVNRLWRWLGRTPVQSFILCPLAVIAFELALHGGRLTLVPWGAPLMAWGYLQYLLVGRYRHPRANACFSIDIKGRTIIRIGSKLAALAAAVCLTALTGSANAGDITVVATGGPLPEVMGVLGPMFEKASGHTIKLSIKAAPAI